MDWAVPLGMLECTGILSGRRPGSSSLITQVGSFPRFASLRPSFRASPCNCPTFGDPALKAAISRRSFLSLVLVMILSSISYSTLEQKNIVAYHLSVAVLRTGPKTCPLLFPRCFQRRPEKPRAPEGFPPGPLFSTNWMVGTGGFEPPTSCVSSKRSPPELRPSVSRTSSTNTGSDENL